MARGYTPARPHTRQCTGSQIFDSTGCRFISRYEIWLDLQRELASRSSRSEHIIAKQSGHFINNDEPQLIVDGVRRMVSGR
jgi:hypothetical protein